MSTDLLRKYLDIITEAESATGVSDFTQQALNSGIAETIIKGDYRKYRNFKLYFAPLANYEQYKQVDIRIRAEGMDVPPVDESIAVFDSRGQFFFNDYVFSDQQKEVIKNSVFKMMHPGTTRGASGAYQKVAGYNE